MSPASTGNEPSEKKRPRVDRYEIIRGLGKGAWGAVYLAHDPKLARSVAVKVLHREYFDHDKYRERFEREARAIAALKHPNIVEIYDYGLAGTKRLFIVMEYLDGPHLGFLEREYGPLPETAVLAVGHELCRALALAHAAGIIHRDLKPENVFIVDGRLVLADFGIVKAFLENSPLGRAAADPRTEVIGTPGFMAPEQLKRESLGAHTDIFSLGALLYFLASGQLAFEASSPYDLAQRFAAGVVEPVQRRRPIISDELNQLILQLLEISPNARPDSIESIREKLGAMLNKRGVTDVREELLAYVTNPTAYIESDRARVVTRAEERFFLSLEESGVATAREWLTFINRIDPDKAHILGTILDKRSRSLGRRWPIVFSLLGALAIATGTAYGLHSWRTRQESPVALHRIFVSATKSTEVLYHGQVLGYTPDLHTLSLHGRRARLVFRTRGEPTLEYYLDPETAAEQELHINWSTGRISLRARPQIMTKE